MTGKQAIKWLADYLKPYIKKTPQEIGDFWPPNVEPQRFAKAQIVLFKTDIESKIQKQLNTTGGTVEEYLRLRKHNEVSDALAGRAMKVFAPPPFKDFILFDQNDNITAFMQVEDNYQGHDAWLILPLGNNKRSQLPLKFTIKEETAVGGPCTGLRSNKDLGINYIKLCNGDRIWFMLALQRSSDDDGHKQSHILTLFNPEDQEGITITIESYNPLLFQQPSIFQEFCNINACVNTEIKTTELTRHEVTALTKNRIPTRCYHEIVIKGSTRYPHDTDSDEPTNTMALHICRGHIKHYGPEKPLFGRFVGNVWCPPHMKGRAENGIIDKTYHIEEETK